MDPRDLLYTNEFIPVESLNEEQVKKNKDNYFPFVELKDKSVNNVEQELVDRGNASSKFVRKQKESKPWNQGSLGNQRPTLSNFTRDIVEDTYFDIKKTRINIDSRLRDFSQFPLPNSYSYFLGEKYNNIISIRLLDYDFKNLFFPINGRNNRISFFIPPPSSILWDNAVPSFSKNYVNNILSNLQTSKTNYVYPFNLIAMLEKTVGQSDVDRYNSFMNNIRKSYFSFEIPPGFYTVNSLKKTIRKYWNQLDFFNSFYLTGPTDTTFSDPDATENEMFGLPQLATVHINPETNVFNVLLRFDEFKINYLETKRGENYIEFELNYATVTAENILKNNVKYPIVPSGFPSIGGIENYQINFVEFFPKDLIDSGDVFFGQQNYYEHVAGNVFRLYFFKNLNSFENIMKFFNGTITPVPLKFSNDELITFNCECNILTEALIGRMCPFFFIAETDNQFTRFFSLYNNCFLNLLGNFFSEEECPNEFLMLNKEDKNKIRGSIVNLDDCSSTLLVTYLGVPFDIKGVGILSNGMKQYGFVFFSYGINNNMNYSAYNYLKILVTFALLNENNQNFQKCYYNEYPVLPNTLYFNEFFQLPEDPPGKLPIIKVGDQYHFYIQNYIFMKLEVADIDITNLVQVKPTPKYAFGSEETYLDSFNSIKNFEYGFTTSDSSEILPTNPECEKFETNGKGIIKQSNKNLNNLFAVLKLSHIPQTMSMDTAIVYSNDIIFNTKQLNNIDTLKISFVDYEGKILDLNWDHSFLLEIHEKVEILKETNINSRTGYVNTVDARPV